MKVPILFGMLALAVALILIIGRASLAGNTRTFGDVVVTERNEAREQQLLLIGSVIGGFAFLLIVAGFVARKKVVIKRP
jgi:O-antigen ligase